jgi:hypothetical protein
MAKTTPKIIYYRDETARKLIKGINTVADVVKVRPVSSLGHAHTHFRTGLEFCACAWMLAI